MYLRFVVAKRDKRSDRHTGIFTALYALGDAGELDAGEIAWLREAESWLNANMPRPDRFAWSSRPNAPNRALS